MGCVKLTAKEAAIPPNAILSNKPASLAIFLVGVLDVCSLSPKIGLASRDKSDRVPSLVRADVCGGQIVMNGDVGAWIVKTNNWYRNGAALVRRKWRRKKK
jgi:hypothetical protein